jgi:hypothetical protein
MALTNAEKQQRFRERHLGVDGEKQRVQYFVSVPAKAQLSRLASYRGYTVTQVIEELAAAAERKLLDHLSPAEARAYLDDTLQHGAPALRRVTRPRRGTMPMKGKRRLA